MTPAVTPTRSAPIRAAWLAAAGLLAWLRWTHPAWLVVAAAGVVLAALRIRGASPSLAGGLILIVAGTVIGLAGQSTLGRLETDWLAFREAEVTRADEALGAELDRVIERGDSAVVQLADQAPLLVSGRPSSRRLLAQVRESAGFAAAILYDAEGQPVVWDGIHQGVVPADVRIGNRQYHYSESPLYGYLYFARPVPHTGGTAVGAVLLREELPESLAPGVAQDFTSRFEGRFGERVRFMDADRSGPSAIWDLWWEGRPLLSVELERPTQPERRAELSVGAHRRVAVALILATTLLVLAASGRARARSLAVAVLVGAAVAPWGELLDVNALFGPAAFRLPGLQVSLGRTLAMALGAAIALGTLHAPARSLGPVVAGVGVAAGVPAALLWLEGAPSLALLSGGEASWVALLLTVVLVLACGTTALLTLGRGRGPRSAWALAAGALLALGIGVVAASMARAQAGHPVTIYALLGLAAFFMAKGLGRQATWLATPLVAAMAALISVAAALPYFWAERTEARMAVAQDDVGRLGTPVDPYLEFLLERLGAQMIRYQDVTNRPIELLYESWVASGLAEEGYPMWLTLWTEGDEPREELPIGVAERRPEIADDFVESTRTATEVRVRRFELRDAHYLATIPLRQEWVATVVVPPRRQLLSDSPLGPLFSSVERSAVGPLSLVPLTPSQPWAGRSDLRWEASPNGFDGERIVDFPEGPYRAHYALDLPSPVLLAARATLLTLFSVGGYLVLVALGRALGGAAGAGGGSLRRALASFRARVTLALFLFFLLSSAGLGLVAWRALSDASARTAGALAERVVQEAAESFLAFEGDLGGLARRVGADLIVYRNGQLERGAVHELVELGIYPGLLPPEVHGDLSAGDALLESAPGRLGRWDYLMAYRRLGRGATMASPIGIEAADLALRRREAVDLVGFAVVLGAIVSLGLALLVGRTLTRPIRRLQVASERVGGGNLAVQLPEERVDEFGAVFGAFNRMVVRLGEAREALVRNTRRTAAIVEEVATGVLAVDPGGMVVLVNPRAEVILGVDVPLGGALPRPVDTLARDFAEWTDAFFADGLPEGSMEFQPGDRRIRVRGRRISSSEPLGGAVFSLEDVTDALRAERVLAWGEMAQQVAHEVKNPLTPIKLGVQHIRRAWADGAEGFDEVLERNVDAVLKEIDRLADIAGSFSRFSAPAADSKPLEPLSLADTVEEVLTLYQSGPEGLRFESVVPLDLPLATGRESELKEVLVNLLENAREAVGSTGRVEVGGAAGNGCVDLWVQDDGAGIREDALGKVFQPHFSTRSSGTGLGLAIVKRLVESWGGQVEARSTVGQGTTMTVKLPPWPKEHL